MQANINDFISEYEQWAGQEKYKDFDFISKSLSPKWKDRLLTNKKFNLWPIIFGPLYRMSLGGTVSGVLLLFLEIFLACLVGSFSNDFSLAVLSFFAFNTLFSLNLNKVYVKQKQAFKKKMQLEKSKISGWEIFWVVLGMLGQHTLFLSTYLCIISWQNINNILPFFLSALQ